MKILKTTDNGGFPFELDDIRWMQDGITEAMALIMGGFDKAESGFVILRGCEASVNGSDVDVSDGIVFTHGQLLEFDAVTIASPFTVPNMDVVTTYDSNGDETFEDGVDRDTYQIDKAAIIQTGASKTQQEFIDLINGFQRIEEIWHKKSVIEDWNDLTISSPATTPSAAFSPFADTPFQYRKCEGNRVELSGSFGHPSGSSGSLGVLPIKYRPNKRVYLPMLRTAHASIGDRFLSLRIDPDGNMYIGDAYTLSTSDEFCVDGLSYSISRGI